MAVKSNLRQALLPVVDRLRSIPAQLGLRQFSVSVVSRTWTGTRAGLGFNEDTSKTTSVDLGKYDTKVVQLTSRDVIASGGLYSAEDLTIGPITPPFIGSGANNAAITDFDPTPGVAPTEIFFNIKGPGYPVAGAWFKKVSQNTLGNFRYTFVVRRTAEIP